MLVSLSVVTTTSGTTEEDLACTEELSVSGREAVLESRRFCLRRASVNLDVGASWTVVGADSSSGNSAIG